jgi:REP element-mobilizing transposase RayT
MSSTHLSLHFHVVFSTKNRVCLIADDWRERLHALIGGAVRHLGGVPEAVGGTDDHVHMLVGLKATHRLADVIRDAKRSSSMWAHETARIPAFGWQDGYGAFTVSASQLEAVKRYIARQWEHHRRFSFEDEYKRLLDLSGVSYDEKYLW